jgi:hypothetical protein
MLRRPVWRIVAVVTVSIRRPVLWLLLTVLPMPAIVRADVGARSRDWQANGFQKESIRGRGRGFDVGQDSTSRFDHCFLLGRGQRGNGENLADDLRTIVGVNEYLIEGRVVGRGKDSIDEGCRGSGLGDLSDDCWSA